MKTIIDAVNELKGDLGNSLNGYIDGCNVVLSHPSGCVYCSKAFYGSEGWGLICTIQQFNDLVKELSRATWIKGASLEEYQKADKEVLKVENKTVEYKGNIYEINKRYEFSDDGERWLPKVLSGIECEQPDFPFVAGPRWKICREDRSQAGTIKPAPVELVEGEVYSFEVGGDTCYGRYNAGIFVTGGRSHNYVAVMCTSITHLTPATK